MRFRKELGDLTALKESIATRGLIHPIVVDSKGNLIAGARRRQACLELGIEPDVRIIDFENPLQAEIDENTCRKDFTAQEIHEIGQYYNEKLSRQTDTQFGNNDGTVVIIDNDREKPIKIVARIVNKGVATVSKINQIFESDCTDIKEKVNGGEISINEAYKTVKKEIKKKYLNDIDPNADAVCDVEEFAANDKKQIKWYNILHGLWKAVNSIAANGGIVTMTKTWSPKRIESLLREVEQIEIELKKIREEINSADRN